MDGSRNRGVFRVSVCGQEEIEQMSRDGSQHSLSTGVFPSLGARSNRRVKFRRFIISPYDRRYRESYKKMPDKKEAGVDQ